MTGFFRLRRQGVAVLFALDAEDLHQLVAVVIREEEIAVEAAFQTGVGSDELFHRPGVARHDHHQVVPVVFHGLQQRLDRLAAKVVLAAGREGIRLVDKQHAAERPLDHFLRLQRRLADVARHQTGAVHFHQLALAQHADRCVQTADQTCNRRLTGTGIADEYHVEAHRRHRQVVLLPQLAHFDEVNEVLDVFFDRFQSDQALQLFHQFVEVRLLLGLLFLGRGGISAAGRLHLGAVLLLETGLTARDKVQRVQPFAALAHAGSVADRSQPVSALGDEFRLAVGDLVIHSRQIQQNVGEHTDERAGGLGAFLRVALGQIPEENGRKEHILLADRAGQVPEQPLRLGPATGIDLIGHRHMALADAARPAPERKRAARHKIVQFRRQFRAADAVEGVGIGNVDLVKFFRGAVPGSRHGGKPPSHNFQTEIIVYLADIVKKGTCKGKANMR